MFLFHLLVAPASALSCIPGKEIYIASCTDNVCGAGFKVVNEFTGNWCDTRPVVKDVNNISEVFRSVFLMEGLSGVTGIYQIEVEPVCLSNWVEGCKESTSVQKLSEKTDDQTLASYRAFWQDKELKALNKVSLDKLSGMFLAFSIILLALAWPFILVFAATKLLKRSVKPLIIFTSSLIITAQFLTAYSLPLSLQWSYDEFISLGSVVSLLLVAAIPVDLLVLFILFRRSSHL